MAGRQNKQRERNIKKLKIQIMRLKEEQVGHQLSTDEPKRVEVD